MTTPQDRGPLLARVLHWLRGGYPDGVPQQDYVALFGILHRQLTDREVDQIARTMVAERDAGDQAPDEEAIRQQVREVAQQVPSIEDVARVSSRLAAAGWPLGGPLDDPDAEEPEAHSGEMRMLARLVAWIREGYPGGVPAHDYQPLLALLERRLTKSEVKKVAKALRKAGISPAGPDEIAAAISDVTDTEPSDSDLRRVRAHLTKKGWPVDFPDPDLPV